MKYRNPFTLPSSWMTYLSLALMFMARYAGPAGFAMRTAGTALLAGAMMYVVVDARKRHALVCIERNNIAAN